MFNGIGKKELLGYEKVRIADKEELVRERTLRVKHNRNILQLAFLRWQKTCRRNGMRERLKR